MPCQILLRRDQSLSQRSLYSSNRVSVFAPSWVKEALEILGKHLKGVKFELMDNASSCFPSDPKTCAETFTITEDFNGHSLKLLQRIARNEAVNVSGAIQTSLYPDIKGKELLYSLRDLVRQCVIAGADHCTGCGGYNCDYERHSKKHRVYICDLAALQFQQPYNTGRLVLVQETDFYSGILDEFIYEKVVGEKKLQYSEILESLGNNDEIKQRYLHHDGFGSYGKKSCFLDTKAYKKFVALDVVQSAVSLCQVAADGDQLIFKFLKYGTGFFAGGFQHELDRLILTGVMDGLEELFENKKYQNDVSAKIKCIELPFYKNDRENAKRIDALEVKYRIKVIFSNCDALKKCHFIDQEICAHGQELIIATTNCGDNHAVCGNEMGFSSVDAAIAENLESKGNLFSPNINLSMGEQYLDL